MSNFPEFRREREDRVDEAIAEFLEAIDNRLPFDKEDWLVRHAEIRKELLDFLDSEKDLGLSHQVLPENVPHELDLTTEFPNAFGNSSSNSASLPIRVPERIGSYRPTRLLGAGGMGQVFEAVDSAGNLVALKLLSPRWLQSDESLQRFKQEGKIASSINHPRCVFVKAADEDAGQPFIVMELMTGRTLKDLSHEDTQLSVTKAVHAIVDVLEGLDEAHALGMIHRDIKPANCYLESNGRVKLGDFGLARSMMIESELTQTGDFIGTPLFASPEQVKGQSLDLRTDIYSVCATLYFLLTGRAPFSGSSPTSVIAKIVSEDPQSICEQNPNVPILLERIVLRGLHRERKERFQSVAELRQALEPFVSGRQSIAAWGRRFAAYGLDSTITSIFGAVVIQLLPMDRPNPGLPIWLYITVLLPIIAYYLACEGLGNATLGKRLLRLHIVDQKTGERPTAWRLVLRSASAILLMGVLTDLLLFAFSSLLNSGDFIALQWAGYLVTYSAMMAPLLFIRRARMLLHDWLSGTMVVDRPTVSPQQQLAILAADHHVLLLSSIGYPTRLGDFVVNGLLCDTGKYAVLLGLDERLGRNVWLYLSPKEEPELKLSRRDCTRVTRLRWLTGGTVDKWRWDAFLACSGAPLKYWTAPDSPLNWQSTKGVIRQLADEMDKSRLDGTRVHVQSLDQLWLDRRGRLVLVDWSSMHEDNISRIGNDPELACAEEPQRLSKSDCAVLCETARLALCGTSLPLSDPVRPIPAIVPLHVRELLQSLTESRESNAVSMTMAELLTTLDRNALKPAESTFENRALGLGFALTPGLILLGLVASFSRLGNQLILDRITDAMVTTEAADWLLQSSDENDFSKATAAIAEFPSRDELQKWLANRDTCIAKLEKEYKVRFASLGVFSAAVASGAHLLEDPVAQIERVNLKWNEDKLVAMNWKSEGLQEPIDLKLLAQQVKAGPELSGVQMLRRSPLYMVAVMLTPLMIWSMWSGVSWGGIAMRIAGLRIVDSKGRPASWRITFPRAFLAGLPFLVLQLLIAWVDLSHPEFIWISILLYQVQLWLFLVYAVLTIAFPRQSPQDWLLGTHLVPR